MPRFLRDKVFLLSIKSKIMFSIQEALAEAAEKYSSDYSIPLIKAALYGDVADLIAVESEKEAEREKFRKILGDDYEEDPKETERAEVIKLLSDDKWALTRMLQAEINAVGLNEELKENIKFLPSCFLDDFTGEQKAAYAFVLFADNLILPTQEIISSLPNTDKVIMLNKPHAAEGSNLKKAITKIEEAVAAKTVKVAVPSVTKKSRRPVREIQEELAAIINEDDEDSFISFFAGLFKKRKLSASLSQNGISPVLKKALDDLVEKVIKAEDFGVSTFFGGIINAEIKELNEFIYSISDSKMTVIEKKCREKGGNHDELYSENFRYIADKAKKILHEKRVAQAAEAAKRPLALDEDSASSEDDRGGKVRITDQAVILKKPAEAVAVNPPVASESRIAFFSGKTAAEEMMGRRVLKMPQATPTIAASAPAPAKPSATAVSHHSFLGTDLFGPQKPNVVAVAASSGMATTLFGLPMPKQVLRMPQGPEIKLVAQKPTDSDLTDVSKDDKKPGTLESEQSAIRPTSTPVQIAGARGGNSL